MQAGPSWLKPARAGWAYWTRAGRSGRAEERSGMSGMCALNALGSRVRGPPSRHDASDGCDRALCAACGASQAGLARSRKLHGLHGCMATPGAGRRKVAAWPLASPAMGVRSAQPDAVPSDRTHWPGVVSTSASSVYAGTQQQRDRGMGGRRGDETALHRRWALGSGWWSESVNRAQSLK